MASIEAGIVHKYIMVIGSAEGHKNPVSPVFDQPRSNERDRLMSCEGVNYSHEAVMSLTRPVKHKGAYSALSSHIKLPNRGELFLHTGKR